MKKTQHMKTYMQSIPSSLEYSPCGFIFAIAWAECTHRGFPQSMHSPTPRTRDKWPKGKFFLFTVWIFELTDTKVTRGTRRTPTSTSASLGLDLDPYLKLLEYHLQAISYPMPLIS